MRRSLQQLIAYSVGRDLSERDLIGVWCPGSAPRLGLSVDLRNNGFTRDEPISVYLSLGFLKTVRQWDCIPLHSSDNF